MANGELNRAERQDWILANPWLWTLLGLAICLGNWATVLLLRESLSDIGLGCLFSGLLATGAGVAIRLNSSATSYLDCLEPKFRYLVLRGLAMLFGLIALTTTVLLLLRIDGINPAQLRLNGLVILWVVVCPISILAMSKCAHRARTTGTISPAEESAALLILAAGTVFCASWALYNPDSPQDWDSIRLFLSVLFIVSLGAAPLMLVTQSVRRLVVSVLVVLHFIGIFSAVMAVPPSPWLAQQLWGRVYQPYLEFMYLNNAYHFYAPEPGPATYLWFRMYYEDPQGKLWAHWLKIPDVDEKGWHKYAVALEYQRMLALTENIVGADPMPNQYAVRPDGNVGYAEWYARRLEHSTNLANTQTIVGQNKQEVDGLTIPFPIHVPVAQQYLKPNINSQPLLASYARHICLAKHPEHEDWKIHHVKVYRVVHHIPEVAAFVNERLDPRDPANYKAYYMGKYSPQGELLDKSHLDEDGKYIPGDPFLYWLLPNLRDPPEHLVKSPVKSWVFKHADDPDWIYTYDESENRHLREEERDILKLGRR